MWALLKNGEAAAAKKCMERAMKESTPDAEMLYHAGMVAAATGDATGARKLLSRALSLNPGFSVLGAAVAAKTLEEMAGKVAGP
jgi:Flp pilus assembly protein TadD